MAILVAASGAVTTAATASSPAGTPQVDLVHPLDADVIVNVAANASIPN
jgi:hypothetical protein